MARRRRNIYQGPGSCHALNEGVYVRGSGVDYETGLAIAYLILEDLSQGYTYDHSCRPIKMTVELAARRLAYLYPLCLKHTGDRRECSRLKRIVSTLLSRGPGAIPRRVVEEMIVREPWATGVAPGTAALEALLRRRVASKRRVPRVIYRL